MILAKYLFKKVLCKGKHMSVGCNYEDNSKERKKFPGSSSRHSDEICITYTMILLLRNLSLPYSHKYVKTVETIETD